MCRCTHIHLFLYFRLKKCGFQLENLVRNRNCSPCRTPGRHRGQPTCRQQPPPTPCGLTATGPPRGGGGLSFRRRHGVVGRQRHLLVRLGRRRPALRCVATRAMPLHRGGGGGFLRSYALRQRIGCGAVGARWFWGSQRRVKP
jgi:hypothetical protein